MGRSRQQIWDADDNWQWCAKVAQGVARGDEWAMTELYERMNGHCRARIIQLAHTAFLNRQEIDDLLHDIYIMIVQQIQRTPLREPERLMGFVMTVILRRVAQHMTAGRKFWESTDDLSELESDMSRQTQAEQGSVTRRQRDTSLRLLIAQEVSNPANPLTILLEREESREILQSLRDSMAELKPNEREILIRFYLHKQPPEQICGDMGITETQYRLWKSRAKAKFGRLGKRQISRRELHQLAAAS